MCNMKAPLLTTRASLASLTQRVHGPRDESPRAILDQAPLATTKGIVVSLRMDMRT